MKKEKNSVLPYIFWSTQTTLVILKLFKLIEISWWLVFSPLLALLGIVLFTLIILGASEGLKKL